MRAVKAIWQKQGDVSAREYGTRQGSLYDLSVPINCCCWKSPSERLVWSAFAKRQCGLLALTKVKRKLSTQDLTLKPQQGLGPEKWIHPVSEWLRGTKLVARLVDRKSFKMETTRWASKFYKFTLCRDFFAGIPQVIRSNHSVYNAQFARR